MPQEFHVVQCCDCHVFQVDIIKKVPKWTCKMCGKKQSVIKVYGKGTGKDCRLQVQQLNKERINLESRICGQVTYEYSSENEKQKYVSQVDNTQNSKWLKFIEDNETVEEQTTRESISIEQTQSNERYIDKSESGWLKFMTGSEISEKQTAHESFEFHEEKRKDVDHEERDRRLDFIRDKVQPDRVIEENTCKAEKRRTVARQNLKLNQSAVKNDSNMQEKEKGYILTANDEKCVDDGKHLLKRVECKIDDVDENVNSKRMKFSGNKNEESQFKNIFDCDNYDAEFLLDI